MACLKCGPWGSRDRESVGRPVSLPSSPASDASQRGDPGLKVSVLEKEVAKGSRTSAKNTPRMGSQTKPTVRTPDLLSKVNGIAGILSGQSTSGGEETVQYGSLLSKGIFINPTPPTKCPLSVGNSP